MWENESGLSMGLVGPMGVLVDGLYTPARLEPGAQAFLMLKPQVELPFPTEGEALAAVLQGTIHLVLPDEPVESFPEAPFVLYSPF